MHLLLIPKQPKIEQAVGRKGFQEKSKGSFTKHLFPPPIRFSLYEVWVKNIRKQGMNNLTRKKKRRRKK